MKSSLVFSLCVFGACTDDRPVTWSFISTAIVEPACGTSGCHSQWSQVSGVVLDTRDVAYKTLVTNPPDGFAPFVVPGQPDQSQLMYLLRGDAIRIMPPDAPLPSADIDVIKQWIVDGAPNN